MLLFGGKTRSTLTREDAAERRVGDAVVVVRNATRDVESFVQPVPQPDRDALRGSGGGVVIGQFPRRWDTRKENAQSTCRMPIEYAGFP